MSKRKLSDILAGSLVQLSDGQNALVLYTEPEALVVKGYTMVHILGAPDSVLLSDGTLVEPIDFNGVCRALVSLEARGTMARRYLCGLAHSLGLNSITLSLRSLDKSEIISHREEEDGRVTIGFKHE